MLREAGLSQTVKEKIPREQCIFVARKRGNKELAPSDDLYRDFDQRKDLLEKKSGKGSAEAHNRAFIECDYERRFREGILGSPEALEKLEGICTRSRNQDLYLVCYEGPQKACHRRILLRIAQERFNAEIRIEGVEPR
ncbi:MAG: hypothetical protein JXL84_05940 [Deltaproteobacteria bacterium]|nr:hypothetical protein [Deltaproteobacteria bacterium]